MLNISLSRPKIIFLGKKNYQFITFLLKSSWTIETNPKSSILAPPPKPDAFESSNLKAFESSNLKALVCEFYYYYYSGKQPTRH